MRFYGFEHKMFWNIQNFVSDSIEIRIRLLVEHVPWSQFRRLVGPFSNSLLRLGTVDIDEVISSHDEIHLYFHGMMWMGWHASYIIDVEGSTLKANDFWNLEIRSIYSIEILYKLIIKNKWLNNERRKLFGWIYWRFSWWSIRYIYGPSAGHYQNQTSNTIQDKSKVNPIRSCPGPADDLSV